MRYALRTLPVACAVIAVIGCGGGSIVFQGNAPDQIQQRTYTLLSNIEQSLPDNKKTQALLTASSSNIRYLIDWPLFWDVLSTRSFRQELYNRQKDALAEIHLQHCESFPSFARFWLSVDSDMGVIVKDEGKGCGFALPVEAGARVLSAVATHPNDDTTYIATLDKIIVERIGSDRAPWLWAEMAREHFSDIECIGRLLIEHGKAKAYFEKIEKYFKTIGNLQGYSIKRLFPPNFVADLLSNPRHLNEWFAAFGLGESLTKLNTYIESLSDNFVPTEIQVDNFLTALERLIPASNVEDNLGSELSNSLDVLRRLTLEWAFPSRISGADRLLRMAAIRLSSIDVNERQKVLSNWHSTFQYTPSAGFFNLIILRFSDERSQVVTDIATDLVRGDADMTDPLDKLLFYAVKLFFPGTSDDSRNNIGAICKFLGTHNATGGSIADDKALGAALGNGSWARLLRTQEWNEIHGRHGKAYLLKLCFCDRNERQRSEHH